MPSDNKSPSASNSAQDDFFNTFIPSIQKASTISKPTPSESKTPISKSNTSFDKKPPIPIAKRAISAQKHNETEELEERIKAYQEIL